MPSSRPAWVSGARSQPAGHHAVPAPILPERLDHALDASGEKARQIRTANNDEMAIGAIVAMEQAGLDPATICIGGVDAAEDALDQMKTGKLAITVFQDARGQGRGALDAAMKMIKGETVPRSSRSPPSL